jgi:hypothetical protein
MESNVNQSVGIERLIEKWKEEFRQTENLEYYSEEDIKVAERKFIKFCLRGRR